MINNPLTVYYTLEISFNYLVKYLLLPAIAITYLILSYLIKTIIATKILAGRYMYSLKNNEHHSYCVELKSFM